MAADDEIDFDEKPWLGPAFEPFKDWLVDGPAGKWPYPFDKEKEFTEIQRKIVERNAALLTKNDGGKAWKSQVDKFENAIVALPTENRKNTRAAFHIRLDQHIFDNGPKELSGFNFPCSVSFAGACFGDGNVFFTRVSFGEGEVWFNAANFGVGDVWFNAADFGEGGVWFNGTAFGKGVASFDLTNFGSGDVWFANVSFGEGDVWFDQTNFNEGDVSFDGASFGDGDVYFSGAKFGKGDIWFDETDFGKGNVSFFGVSFGEGELSFDGAKISDGDVIFSYANFGAGDIRLNFGKLRITDIHASHIAIAGSLYVSAHFPESADFSQLTVQGNASFAGSSFDEVPDFTDAKFDRPPEVSNMIVPYPKLAHTGERKHMSFLSRGFFKTAVDENDVRKFRKLKAMALAANDHEKDGEFFAKEMLAKRGTETIGFFWLLFNTLYWRLSNFGQSFLSPFLWLMGSFAIFGMVCWVKIGEALGFGDRLWFAADFSFRNMLPLLGTLFNSAVGPEEHKSWYQTTYDTLGAAGVDVDGLISLGVIQNIFGGVLLFLFLLALRNRFRLK